MNDLTVYPKPEYCDMKIGQYDCSNNMPITPYSDLSWKELIVKYGIQIPAIVDMTMGKSVCCACNAVYVGFQPRCGKPIVWNSTPGQWHDQRGYKPNTDYKTYTHTIKPCDGSLKWDLHEEFYTQKEFFSLLEKINRLPDLSYDPVNKFKNFFPPGVADHLKIRLIEQDIQNFKVEIGNALNQIASKMNSAGACLSFNLGY